MIHTAAIYPGPTRADLAHIPDDLTSRPQWVLWRGVDKRQKDGTIKLDKIPVDPQTLRNADRGLSMIRTENRYRL